MNADPAAADVRDWERAARSAAETAALDAGPDADPVALFQRLPGYWPPDVVSRLDEAAGSGGPGARAAAALAAAVRSGPAADPDHGDPVRLHLPVPHPLDSDWRFAHAARQRLLEQASAEADGPLVLLGTPTLFAHCCMQLDLRKIVLVDRGRRTVEAARSLAAGHGLLGAHRADLTDPASVRGLFRGDAQVVVADPPWYRPEQLGFLVGAAAALRPGGTLLLATSPAGTRSAAEADRQRLLQDADHCGLRLTEAEPGALRYTSSPFERAALLAAGLSGVPTDWRRGDLLTFRRSARPGPPPLAAGPPPPASEWTEVAAGRVRLRVGPDRTDLGPDVEPAVPGAVSRSVSRRSPDRDKGNVITSGNGVWTVRSTPVAAAVRRLALPGPDGALEGPIGAAVAAEQDTLQAWGWS